MALSGALVLGACANTDPTETVVEAPNDSPAGTASETPSAETSDDVPATSDDGTDGAEKVEAPLDDSSETADELPVPGRYFAEYGPITLSTFERGLESCTGIDPAPFAELLGIELIVNTDQHLANVEPSAPDRTCILFAAEDPEIDLVRINATDDAARWVRWIDHNPQRQAADVGVFQAQDDLGSFTFADGSDLGYATLHVEADGARLLVEAREWDFGISYSPADIFTVAAMSSVAATQLASPGPGPATSALASCADLDTDSWKDLVDAEIGEFKASSFNGSLTCTTQTLQGDRIQVLVGETDLAEDALTRTGLLRGAYENTLRTPNRLDLDDVDSAWEIDRIYDESPSQAEQSVLQEVFGSAGGTFARVSVRQSTAGGRAPIEKISRALVAVLNGESFNGADADGPVFRLPETSAVKQFVDSGASIEVAPLARGLVDCADLDLAPFETITGKELVAVTGIFRANLNPNSDAVVESGDGDSDNGEIKGGESIAGEQITECTLVRENAPTTVEMRVSASTSADGVKRWVNADLITGLVAIDGIDDTAFWNEGDGNAGDNATSTDAGLILYVEEGDARLLVEMVKYETTPDIDVFWVSQAFARGLFAAAS